MVQGCWVFLLSSPTHCLQYTIWLLRTWCKRLETLFFSSPFPRYLAPNSESIEDEIRVAIRHSCSILLRRAKRLDVPLLISSKFLQAISTHVHFYVKGRRKCEWDLMQLNFTDINWPADLCTWWSFNNQVSMFTLNSPLKNFTSSWLYQLT